jgi:hypothetical protein
VPEILFEAFPPLPPAPGDVEFPKLVVAPAPPPFAVAIDDPAIVKLVVPPEFPTNPFWPP